RVKTFPSGKRVRLTITSDDRVIETKVLPNKTKRTKVGKRLAARRRRNRR
ncbi:hypothetical protein LCGC14_2513700, partial [marine sediment metagenome]